MLAVDGIRCTSIGEPEFETIITAYLMVANLYINDKLEFIIFNLSGEFHLKTVEIIL